MDPTTRKDWKKNIGEQQGLPTFEAVSEFISGRIRALQASDAFGSGTSTRHPEAVVPRQRKFLGMTTIEEERCQECQDDHRLHRCGALLSQDPKGRL